MACGCEARRRGLYGGGDEVGFYHSSKVILPARCLFRRDFSQQKSGALHAARIVLVGSMHLADGANMYHIKPEARSRRCFRAVAKTGIGHTIPVMRATWAEADRLKSLW